MSKEKKQREYTSEQKEIVLVTGAGTGIGRATCVALAAANPQRKIYVHYGNSAGGAEETAKLVTEQGATAVTIQANLRDPQAAANLIAAVVEAEGQIDVLVNNAGITRDTLAVRMSDAAYEEVYEVNQRAAFILMREAARPMMRRRYGRIVNVSSIVGLKGNPGQMNYAAAKAALIAMTKTLALELASRGVTVNAVAPGFIATAMTDAMPEAAAEAILQRIPLGRMGRPEDVAATIAFLAGAEASYITAQCISVDGGLNT